MSNTHNRVVVITVSFDLGKGGTSVTCIPVPQDNNDIIIMTCHIRIACIVFGIIISYDYSILSDYRFLWLVSLIEILWRSYSSRNSGALSLWREAIHLLSDDNDNNDNDND